MKKKNGIADDDINMPISVNANNSH